MKINVRVNDEVYEVEVGDLNTRPVIATIEGERFEVWPEMARALGQATALGEATTLGKVGAQSETPVAGAPTAPPAREAVKAPPALPQPVVKTPPPAAPAAEGAPNSLRAPIPGVILSIAVQTGETVERGQELCVLEAMKMNNTLRASRAGVIATIHVTVGQHVKHGDLLIEYI